MVILKKFILIFLIFILNTAIADEIPIPEFLGETIKYKDSYGGELILGEKTTEELKFWFRSMGGELSPMSYDRSC